MFYLDKFYFRFVPFYQIVAKDDYDDDDNNNNNNNDNNNIN